MQKIKNVLLIANICLVLIIIGFASPVWAAIYYVRSGGNDNLDGLSAETAWATTSKVEATVRNGDTVYFRSQDTWRGTATILTLAEGVTYDGSTWGTGTRATLQASGDGGIYALVGIGVDDVVFRGFKVDGNGYATGQIYISYRYGSVVNNVTIDDCEITNNRTADSGNQYYYGIIIGQNAQSTTRNITITDCHIHHTGHEGLTIYPSWGTPGNKVDTVLVRGCTIHDTGQVSGTNRGNAIDMANDVDNVTIEFNTIYNVNGNFNSLAVITYGTMYPAHLGRPDNVIVRYNLSYNNNYGLSLISGNSDPIGSASIYGNIFINSFVSMQSGNYQDADILIYNNIFYRNNSSNYPLRTNVSASTGTLEMRNNIFYSGGLEALYDSGGSSFNYITHTNNLFFRTSGESDNHIRVGYTYYDRSEVKNFEATAQNTNPSFTGGTLPTGFSGTYGTDMVPNHPYFAISSGAALENGATLGSPYNGTINGAGLANPVLRVSGRYDIGSYENDGVEVPTDPSPSDPIPTVQGVRVIINGIPIASVNASSNDGNIPENAIDNYSHTRWSALGSDEWIEFDLGAENTLGYALISFYDGDQRSANFRIQVSNDRVNWQDAFVGNSSGATLQQERFNFASGMSGRYVRYIGYGNSLNLWNSITEFDVF